MAHREAGARPTAVRGAFDPCAAGARLLQSQHRVASADEESTPKGWAGQADGRRAVRRLTGDPRGRLGSPPPRARHRPTPAARAPTPSRDVDARAGQSAAPKPPASRKAAPARNASAAGEPKSISGTSQPAEVASRKRSARTRSEGWTRSPGGSPSPSVQAVIGVAVKPGTRAVTCTPRPRTWARVDAVSDSTPAFAAA